MNNAWTFDQMLAVNVVVETDNYILLSPNHDIQMKTATGLTKATHLHLTEFNTVSVLCHNGGYTVARTNASFVVSYNQKVLTPPDEDV